MMLRVTGATMTTMMGAGSRRNPIRAGSEDTFTLSADDPCAPTVVRIWADMREMLAMYLAGNGHMSPEDLQLEADKIREARETARRMYVSRMTRKIQEKEDAA